MVDGERRGSLAAVVAGARVVGAATVVMASVESARVGAPASRPKENATRPRSTTATATAAQIHRRPAFVLAPPPRSTSPTPSATSWKSSTSSGATSSSTGRPNMLPSYRLITLRPLQQAERHGEGEVAGRGLPHIVGGEVNDDQPAVGGGEHEVSTVR